MKRKRIVAPPSWKELGWFVFLWCASVTGLGAAAFAIRLLMTAAGLSA